MPLASQLVSGSYLAKFKDTVDQLSNNVSSTPCFETKRGGVLSGTSLLTFVLNIYRFWPCVKSGFLKPALLRIDKGQEGK